MINTEYRILTATDPSSVTEGIGIGGNSDCEDVSARILGLWLLLISFSPFIYLRLKKKTFNISLIISGHIDFTTITISF